MLKTLYIKSHALIDEIEVQFDNGLNVLTGETGAGKSTIIEALNLVLGERASTDVVRKGSEKAVVEGVFQVTGNPKIQRILHENQIEFADELILRREVSLKGQSRCFVNDTPTTLTVLSSIGDLLVDLHGQHQHQSLLKVDTHIDLLDEFGRSDGLLLEFQDAFERLRQSIGKYRDLRQREHQLKEKLDLYEFQLKEIDAIDPQAGEEEELERELKILENAEKLFEATNRIYALLYEDEHSLNDQLAAVSSMLEELTSIDKSFEEHLKEATAAKAVISELAKTIGDYRARIEFNPEKLEQIRERLGRLSLLKKKYGGSIEAIREHREKIRKEVALGESLEETLCDLQKQIEKERMECSRLAEQLSVKRKETSRKLSKDIVKALAELGIPNSRFEVRIENRPLASKETGFDTDTFLTVGKEKYETTTKGIDFVEFFISTNVGEDLKPLARVASGGEISRIMLALKSILAKADRLPLLIFDEIDIGISGRIAQAVALSLKNLAKFHQIIVITHLPQIASVADHHYVVEKIEERGRAFTHIRKLSHDERIWEVARLMSGAEITETALEGAKEMIGWK